MARKNFTYDEIGNPLTYYNGYTFTWAEGRRLQSVTTGENQTTSYLYDADGLRVRKTNPNGTYIQYHLMNGRYLGETHYNAQNQPQKHIRYTYDESGSIIGIGIKNSDASVWTEYYFEKNLQGDVIAVYTAANGSNGLPELVASYTYDSWGNILSATGELAQINPFRYRSYYYDTETEFYYLRSRYYNPEIGRFLNADAGIAGVGGNILGYNLFAYCLNNPINMSDPLGNWPIFSFFVQVLATVATIITVEAIAVLSNSINNSKADNNPATTTNNRILNDQNLATGQNFDYGVCPASWNACEAIAVHNAKVLEGIDSSLSDTIRTFQAEGAMMALGVFGSNPYAIGNVLDREGIEYSRVGTDDMTQTGTYIISFWIEGAPWNGLHTVAVSYDGETYTAYNLNGDGGDDPISISDYEDRYICGYYLR